MTKVHSQKENRLLDCILYDAGPYEKVDGNRAAPPFPIVVQAATHTIHNDDKSVRVDVSFQGS